MGNFLSLTRTPHPPVNKPTKISAAVTSTALSLLFIGVYDGCAWVTAHRTDVHTWHYTWERFLPFVPVLILPYMSIDLFFVAGPFLCTTRNELRVLTQRITFAILVAGAFFLLVPLHLDGMRPETSGWTAPMFRFLHGFDQTSNLFPSLHIALRTILAVHYARHTKGVLQAATRIWFSLIGFSTLFIYQHHFVDVAGGFILGAITIYLFHEEDIRLPVLPNHRVGFYYAAVAGLAIAMALIGWPWAGILFWPALACALTAAAYWGIGPSIYRKTNGQLPWTTRLIFAPCLIGQKLSLRHYRRNCKAWNKITPNLWISSILTKKEAAEAQRQGVTAILDLTAEFSETIRLRALDYKNIPILDLTAPTQLQLAEAANFTHQQTKHGIVCVHCKVGYSRSAVVVGAYLLASGQTTTVEQTVAMLKSARPSIIIRPEAIKALQEFSQTRRSNFKSTHEMAIAVPV
ncbi:MAG TPA: phosphatase PAP2/dual specificity phosphatase family protein [Verrucomicrobiae bacterium]|nr:phosphatase PAP2/dual specificity phosphatase family protein [Verrucomicrobiae bacterium]